MAGPPPHGHSLGLWKCVNKIRGAVIFIKENTSLPVVIPVTDEEGEYFVVGQSYEFTATQP